MFLSKRRTIAGQLNAFGLFVALSGMTVVAVVSVVLGSRILFDREGETAFPTVVAEYFWIGIWLILSAAIVLLVGWGLFWLLARRIARPLAQLTEAAERASISSGPSVLDTDPQLDEVWRLATAFNRLLDERARQSDEIRNLSRNVLHDLRAPLVQMCEEADRLSHELVNPKDAALCIQKEGRALLRIVDMSAEISNNYSGHDAAPPRTLDLSDLARDVVDTYFAAAEIKGIGFKTEIPQAAVPFIGHEIKLRRLVGNLLDNAIKFTPDGGRITLTLVADAHSVSLTVTDTGCGIPSCEQGIMYERFFRGAAAGRCPGTGLGLSMVRSIVTFYHGDISCVSEVGKGTTFRVTLPKARPNDADGLGELFKRAKKNVVTAAKHRSEDRT